MTSNRIQNTRRILTPTEREHLKDRYDQNEAEKKGVIEGVDPRLAREGYDPSVQGNTRYLDEENKRIKEVLARGEPEDVAREKKAAMERRKKELADYLASKMVPKTGTAMRPGRDPGFRKAVNMMARNENSAEFAKAASEYKNIMRTLDPHDPEAANLENIRPKE
jgi:hypothetical protein